MILHNIKQCNRVCYCVEYLQFRKLKDYQVYLKCYQMKEKEFNDILNKFDNHLKYFND